METKEQIEMKKQYIYENINKVSDHKHYIHLIEMNKSPHTKNSNGIFINLNTASDTIIHQFYTYIKNELMNNNLNSNSIEKKFYQDKIDLVKKKKETRKHVGANAKKRRMHVLAMKTNAFVKIRFPVHNQVSEVKLLQTK